MAHKKKSRKVSGTRHKRRRVSGPKAGSIEHFALLTVGGIAGGLAGAFASQAANTAMSSTAATTPWLPGGLVAGVGGGIAFMAKENPIGLGFGVGMASVAGTLAINAAGFLNVPGVSGVANMSNAPLNSPVIRKALGQAPGPFINQTVGSMGRKYRAMGALATN